MHDRKERDIPVVLRCGTCDLGKRFLTFVKTEIAVRPVHRNLI
jgi:hypothetical protein